MPVNRFVSLFDKVSNLISKGLALPILLVGRDSGWNFLVDGTDFSRDVKDFNDFSRDVKDFSRDTKEDETRVQFTLTLWPNMDCILTVYWSYCFTLYWPYMTIYWQYMTVFWLYIDRMEKVSLNPQFWSSPAWKQTKKGPCFNNWGFQIQMNCCIGRCLDRFSSSIPRKL